MLKANVLGEPAVTFWGAMTLGSGTAVAFYLPGTGTWALLPQGQACTCLFMANPARAAEKKSRIEP